MLNNLFESGVGLLVAKAGIVAISAGMAIVAVLMNSKKHTLPSAILAIIAGTVLGVIAASSIVALMDWPEQVGYGISAVFAISGEGLVKTLIRISNDPLSAWSKWRGK